MVLVDTSVWIDHLRRGDAGLASLLETREVLCHPFIIGEIACGHLTSRKEILRRLGMLPSAAMVRHPEALEFIETRRLSGMGLGFIDMNLLAAASLGGNLIWSRDKALRKAADALKISY